ncbi:hypothetical protein EDD21DRAFT_35045 [Dissophora ornata]|nr:hypothetical protein EDD21DRAFT_35045 [Dissophora ornata]
MENKNMTAPTSNGVIVPQYSHALPVSSTGSSSGLDTYFVMDDMPFAAGDYKVNPPERNEDSLHHYGTHQSKTYLQGHIFRSDKSEIELQRYFITNEESSRLSGDMRSNGDKLGALAIKVQSPTDSPSCEKTHSLTPERQIAGPRTTDLSVTVLGSDIVVLTGIIFDDLTAEFGPLVKENIRQLMVDFFVLLSTSDNGSISTSKKSHNSYFGAQFIRDQSQHKEIVKKCLTKGYVSVLLYYPSEDGLQKMVQESQQGMENITPYESTNKYQGSTFCKSRRQTLIFLSLSLFLFVPQMNVIPPTVAENSIAVKIEYSENGNNYYHPHDQYPICNTSQEQAQTYPNMDGLAAILQGPLPFAYLLEKIIHEILIAHQHDVWCECGSTHVDTFWFERLVGDADGEQSYYAMLELLEPILEKWMEAMRGLEDLHTELLLVHIYTAMSAGTLSSSGSESDCKEL